MRRIAFVGLAIVVGLGLLSQAGGCGGAAAGVGAVEGYVYFRAEPFDVVLSTSPPPPEGYQPAVNATIQFPDGTTVVTDASAFFYATNVSLGTYAITITIPGYPPFTVTVTVTPGGIHSGGTGGIS